VQATVNILRPAETLTVLVCPVCGHDELRMVGRDAGCVACGRLYPCRGNVIDLVVRELLEEDAARELEAHTATPRKAERRARRKSPLDLAIAERPMPFVAAMLDELGAVEIVSLGSGSGLELSLLLRHRSYRCVFSADLAWTQTAAVPALLEGVQGDLGLVSCDFNRPPFRDRAGLVVLVHHALHHSPPAIRALETLLRRFDRIVVVEPTTNWLVELLARARLAKRREYSGLDPDWLRLADMRSIGHGLGFDVQARTWWELPVDRLPRLARRRRVLWRPLLALLGLASRMTAPFSFGSMAAVSFSASRPPARGPAGRPP
jgi:hypothetical protein